MARHLEKSIETMTFEESLAELENLVKDIESGVLSLENSIDDYELGDALRRHCETKLKESQMRVEKIIKKENGDISYENFEKI